MTDINEKLRTEAEVDGKKLPVHHPFLKAADPEGNFYILATDDGVEITTMCEDGLYWVIVSGEPTGPRQYDDRTHPHARNVFWTAMLMAYEKGVPATDAERDERARG